MQGKISKRNLTKISKCVCCFVWDVSFRASINQCSYESSVHCNFSQKFFTFCQFSVFQVIGKQNEGVLVNKNCERLSLPLVDIYTLLILLKSNLLVFHDQGLFLISYLQNAPKLFSHWP